MDPGYIQHNANIPTGRAAFKEYMGKIPGRMAKDAKPIQEAWITPPDLILVNGPYCLMMTNRKAKDPDDPTREYTWDHFNVIRVENGLIKEHWDDFIVSNQPGCKLRTRSSSSVVAAAGSASGGRGVGCA